VEEIENIIIPSADDVIKGQIAFGGKVRGLVRIVLDPTIIGLSFDTGDILVTGMTRPEFLPLLKKSAGFITDSGGILSHAAIIARELKKPCLIDTKVATQSLKDGDIVELDADQGTVKILKRA
jgi:pyruvate,water dikinase